MTTPNDPEAYSNPVRLNVATRESSSNAIAGPSTSTSPSTRPLNERERLFEARKANEIVRRKGDKWADKLMEENVDRETFKKALRYITSQSYLEITSERHLNNLCSYPLCPKPPLAPYNPNKRFRISTLNRSITEVEGNKEEGYCTRSCRVKSEWVRTKLEEGGSVLGRGKAWTVELVEDLGLDLEDVSGMVNGPKETGIDGGKKTGQSSISSNGNGGTMSTMDAIRQPSSYDGQRRQSAVPRIPASSTPLPPSLNPPTGTPADMLANLHIHERPIPPTSAPGPSPQRSNPLPHLPASSITSPSRSKRVPTSIIGEQSKLAQTVLKASKAMNPMPQVNPDSEDEGEHEEVEWEREVGLGWGGDTREEGEDEGDDLWEAMRTAREIEG